MSDYIKEVAKTILDQLNYGGRRKILRMSWGAHAFRYGQDATMTDGKYQWPFLRFKAQGRRFGGWVYIYLNTGRDTYCVSFKNRAGQEVMERIEECFNDNFVELIDERIEKVNVNS